ncbi:MAG: hypothetical protein K0Q72_1051, partial [Armatimonadetes bacterium]|nr:hypothetical protein [Armatimonadota bacterium]
GSLVLAAVAALLWVAVAMFVRTARYREVARRATEVECEYPCLLGELRTYSAE